MKKNSPISTVFVGLLVITAIFLCWRYYPKYMTKGNFRKHSSQVVSNETTRRLLQVVIYDYDSIRRRLHIPVFPDDAQLSGFLADAVLLEHKDRRNGSTYATTYFFIRDNATLFYERGTIRSKEVQLDYVFGSPGAIDSVLDGSKPRDSYDFRTYFQASIEPLKTHVATALSKAGFDSVYAVMNAPAE